MNEAAETLVPAQIKMRLMRWRVRVARWLMLPELDSDAAHGLRQRVVEDGTLNQGYVLMCALSAGIATLGLLQSSTAVVIGAMLISPLMGPIAALGFGFASLDGQRIREAARVVLVGAAIGIATGMLLTWLSPIRNATPEILARTQPTLLDFAVALFSGLAGGYATVLGKGGTAIGVAIATALMPPLATVGYGLGVMQPGFTLGALLLFLTNLSAIAFSFALIARLSGAARPLARVEFSARHVIFGLAAFAALAVPLAATLYSVVRETGLRSAARSAILKEAGKGSTIAQLDASWSLLGDPVVSAVVITPRYLPGETEAVRARLATTAGENLSLTVQQVLAADVPAQTRAMVDAAMERTVAGINSDVPPFQAIRAAIGLPTRGLWTNRAERIVNVEPLAAPGWSLADFRALEGRATAQAGGWTVRVVPPVDPQLTVALDPDQPAARAVSPQLAAWALSRWGLARVEGTAAEDADLSAVRATFDAAGIALTATAGGEAGTKTLRLTVVPPPPGQSDRP